VSERLFATLAARLAAGEAAVLATVLSTQGAVPRRRGSRMLVAADHTEGSVGGGEAEARVLAAAQALLASADDPCAQLTIDLSGRPGAAGICGGRMEIALRRWRSGADWVRAAAIADALARGETVTLEADDLGASNDPMEPITVAADARLLIIGAGHCGEALHALARTLDFELWVHDARADRFGAGRFTGATTLCGDATLLARALDTRRAVFAVLLNRDFAADIAALNVLATRPPAFTGMMGSRRRIAQVRDALPEHADFLARVIAPVGLDIDAQTPAEIAVSILAQLVAERRRLDESR
jgi:xanthine dehydrogenase accessory factor